MWLLQPKLTLFYSYVVKGPWNNPAHHKKHLFQLASNRHNILSTLPIKILRVQKFRNSKRSKFTITQVTYLPMYMHKKTCLNHFQETCKPTKYYSVPVIIKVLVLKSSIFLAWKLKCSNHNKFTALFETKDFFFKYFWFRKSLVVLLQNMTEVAKMKEYFNFENYIELGR